MWELHSLESCCNYFFLSQFGRKKKKFRGKSSSTPSSKESEKKEVKKEEEEEEDEEDDEEDGDVSKYKLDVSRGVCRNKYLNSDKAPCSIMWTPFLGRRWRGRRWRPVKVRVGRQRRRRWQSSQEKGQPVRFLALLLALFQLQFSVQVQVNGQRSRVTPGKMSVSAQSSSDSLINVSDVSCNVVLVGFWSPPCWL